MQNSLRKRSQQRKGDIGMEQQYAFRAVIEDAGTGGAFITIRFDVEEAFGKKRTKVKAWIDGELYRGSLARLAGTAFRNRTGDLAHLLQEDKRKSAHFV